MKKIITWTLVFIGLLISAAAGLLAYDGHGGVLKPVEYGVVLGNQVFPDGRMSARLRGRMDKAVELVRAGLISKVMVSGAVGVEGVDEAQVMAAYLGRQLPGTPIITDSTGFNTRATALNAASLIDAREVTVISQYFHITRCRMALRKAGFKQVQGAAANYYEWRDVFSLIREVLALAYYKFKGYI